jgi:triple functional domain protein
MRGNANTSAGAKTALKILQEHFADFVHQVILIKPENFWQKQRSSISSNKYKFEVTTISIQTLGKMADLAQLTNDFDGLLQYDHNQWLELRVQYEDFLWQVNDVSDHIEDFQEDLVHSDLAEDVNSSKHQNDNHSDMKRKILKLPLDDLDALGQKLLAKLTQYNNRTKAANNSSSQQQTNSKVATGNPDISDTINLVIQHLDTLRNAQQHLMYLWQQKKTKLDQCFQMRLFEQDCDKMFEWIMHNSNTFQQNYMNIGVNHSIAKSLQDEHSRFALTTMTTTANINRIMSVADRLVESNHYATPQIHSIASRLNKTWKDFTNQLDERCAVLSLSVLFHHKAEQYAESVLSWSAAVEASVPNPCDAENLETAIRTHQSLYEAMCHAYTEVHSTSKKLLYQLDHLVQICNQPNGNKVKIDNGKHNNPAADYSEGATHVLTLIHQILSRNSR